QLRMSPGGSMFNSLRKRPLEPPSSLTVTTAERSRMMGKSTSSQAISVGERAYRFRPFSRVERPVPPPMATTRRPRACADCCAAINSALLDSIVGTARLDDFFVAQFLIGGTCLRSRIRIEQLGEARV